MVRITAYIRPHKAEEVKSALAMLPISGMSVNDARGCGSHPEQATSFLGQEVLISLPVRTRIDVVVPDELSGEIIDTIERVAHTGQPGDGKIFVENIIDAVRIRTEERGEDAI